MFVFMTLTKFCVHKIFYKISKCPVSIFPGSHGLPPLILKGES